MIQAKEGSPVFEAFHYWEDNDPHPQSILATVLERGDGFLLISTPSNLPEYIEYLKKNAVTYLINERKPISKHETRLLLEELSIYDLE